jgi:hypothetical protein
MYYLCVKIFNTLLYYIKTEFDNPKKFKVVLKKFLYENSFYSSDDTLTSRRVKLTFGYTSTNLYYKSVCIQLDEDSNHNL